VHAGATDILVGVGGSASTDGGAGALQVLAPGGGPSILPDGVRIRVCADVRTRFLDAAAVFGPQKGAGPDTVRLLAQRLQRVREQYQDRFGVDVQSLERSGAAGGLSGGLAAIGAELVDGFGTLADAAGLDDALAGADLVVTGEGRFDAQSLAGKVVGGVIDRAGARGVPVLVVAGSADPAVRVPAGVTVTALVDAFGSDAAFADTTGCITRAVTTHLLPGH
jgi:glycerate kinase